MTDKATPTTASVESRMANRPALVPPSRHRILVLTNDYTHASAAVERFKYGTVEYADALDECDRIWQELASEVERLAAQAAPPMRLVGHCWMEPRGTLRLAETDPPPAGSFPIYTPSQAPVVQATSEPLRKAAQRALDEWHKYAEQLPQSDAVEALEWGAMSELRSALASSGATTQAVRMLTPDEIDFACKNHYIPRAVLEAIRKFCAVNAGRTIPADGVIGGM